MTPKGRVWAAAATGVAVGLLVGAGSAWGYYSGRMAQLQTTVSSLAEVRAGIEARAEKAESELASATAALQRAEQSSTAATAPAPPSDASASERIFGFVTKATAGSKPTVVVDVAQMLTGDAAAKAAAAHGDEAPSNDYYIVNDNKRLRTYPVASGVSVKVVAETDGTSDPDGHAVSFTTWTGYFASPTDTNAGIREGAYWFTLEKGVVTAIEGQYLP